MKTIRFCLTYVLTVLNLYFDFFNRNWACSDFLPELKLFLERGTLVEKLHFQSQITIETLPLLTAFLNFLTRSDFVLLFCLVKKSMSTFSFVGRIIQTVNFGRLRLTLVNFVRL